MKIKYELLNERLMSNKKSKMYDYSVLKQFQDEQAKIWKFTKLRGGGGRNLRDKKRGTYGNPGMRR